MRTSSAVTETADLIGPQLDVLVQGLRHPEMAALNEQLERLLRAEQSTSGYTLARPGDYGRATAALQRVLGSADRAFATKDARVLNDFFDALDRLETAGIRTYPSEHARLALLRAEALLAAGREAEAVEALTFMSSRPHAVEGDAGMFRRLFAADMTARMSAGQAASLVPVALGRAQFLTAMEPFSAVTTFRMLAPLLAADMDTGMHAQLIRWAARRFLAWRLAAPRSTPARWRRKLALQMGALTGAAALLALALRTHAPPSLASSHHQRVGRSGAAGSAARRGRGARWLVSRAMGGLGDILLMTPGLRALAARLGGPVHFATKRAFFPMLEGNPNVVLLDIDGDIALENYDRWINLSNCPAGRHESRTRPAVLRSRVEIFAAAMRIGRATLMRHGLQPEIVLSSAEQDEASRLRQKFGAGGRPIIGIQPYSRDTYKNFPEIIAVAECLAETSHVLVFHNAPVSIKKSDQITVLSHNSLRSNIIHMHACDYFVSVDSAFYHVAAALDVPSVGIFGPTDGRLFSMHHPRHLLAPVAASFPCTPCWRNEDIPCYLTNRHQSACLSNMNVETILATVDALRRTYAARPTRNHDLT
jgi:hypothetical protein